MDMHNQSFSFIHSSVLCGKNFHAGHYTIVQPNLSYAWYAYGHHLLLHVLTHFSTDQNGILCDDEGIRVEHPDYFEMTLMYSEGRKLLLC